MKIYLVGGAVRDQLLNRPVKEKDWVVVGSTPEEMLAQGFKPVGKDFPVFLHPETKEEYALARTERKVAKGYKGFIFHSTPDVTLEEDLKRRDLTINAIAQTKDGKLIDPFHGQQDLKKKRLRHVSPAFAEDPVRILRAARFAARFPEFTVHPETNQLMKKMVENGEVDALVAERVWKELELALAEPAPERFFEVLIRCTAHQKLFPELKDFTGLIKAKSLTKPLLRFAALMHQLKPETIKAFCKRLRVPGIYQSLAVLTANHFKAYVNCLNLSAKKLLNLIENCDAIRRPERFKEFLEVCGVLDEKDQEVKRHKLMTALKAANSVDARSLLQEGLGGKEFAAILKQARIKSIEEIVAR